MDKHITTIGKHCVHMGLCVCVLLKFGGSVTNGGTETDINIKHSPEEVWQQLCANYH